MTNGTTSDWTNERVELLLEEHAKGTVASKIAKILGGVSRNAVIGKLHRLGYCNPRSASFSVSNERRSQNVARYMKGRQSVRRHRSPQVKIAVEQPALEIVPKTLVSVLDLEPHACKWPYTTPEGKQRFGCACKRAPGLPYCEMHAARAYRVPEPRKPDPEPRQPIRRREFA